MTGAELFRAWRERKGLTQKQVADRLGVSTTAVCDWENGKKVPRLGSLDAIERVTGRAVRVRAWLSPEPKAGAAA